ADAQHLPLRRRPGGNRHRRRAHRRGGGRRERGLRRHVHHPAEPRDEAGLHLCGVPIRRGREPAAGAWSMSADSPFPRGVRMKRAALPLLVSLAACSLREPRVSAEGCASAAQYSHGDVCFLGECRAPSANLSLVSVDVRPPVGSQFGWKDAQIDLHKSVLNDFTLAVSLSIGPSTGSTGGTVAQAQDSGGPSIPVSGAMITFSDHAPLIPDRIEQIVSVTDATGNYTARVPQGPWDVPLQPPAPLPPLRFGTLDTASPMTTYLIPATSALPRLEGRLTFADAGTPPIEGASVTAIDAQGT